MQLICRPPGRGNWRIVTVLVSLSPDLFRARPGQRITLGDLVLRIVEVQA